jgi:hypothetical protein
MAHSGNLGSQRLSDDIQDIRSATIRGLDGQELGRIDDIILDHESMEILYLVIDSGGWLEPRTFLFPSDRVSLDEDHEDGVATGVTRRQIENAPQYDEQSLRSADEWKKYEQEFKKYWAEEPVMHIKGSDRIITPPEEPIPAQASSMGNRSAGSGHRELNAADLFPNRLTDIFSDPTPSSGKVTLRPKSVARAEKAHSGVALLKPHWWEAFENYLRVNKSDIQSKCPHCASTSDPEVA